MKTLEEREREAYISGNPMDNEVIKLIEAGERIPSSVGDIAAGFPDEDFLDSPMARLEYLIKNTHKNNKLLPELQKILDELDAIATTTNQNAEHGMHELKNLKIQLGI